jgi:hypothetical protein
MSVARDGTAERRLRGDATWGVRPLRLPKLRPLIGKTVEIIVREERKLAAGDEWSAFYQNDPGDLIDPEIYNQYREFDRQHGKLPE